MSKTSWPILYSKLPYKMGKNFLDIQYIYIFDGYAECGKRIFLRICMKSSRIFAVINLAKKDKNIILLITQHKENLDVLFLWLNLDIWTGGACAMYMPRQIRRTVFYGSTTNCPEIMTFNPFPLYVQEVLSMFVYWVDV